MYQQGIPTKEIDMRVTTPNTRTGFSVQTSRGSKGEPQWVTFYHQAASEEAAMEMASHFPKSHAFKVQPVRGMLPSGDCGIVYWSVSSQARLLSTKGNEKNETGIKRYHAIMAKAAKAGIPTVFDAVYANSYASREEFEAAIAI